MSEENKTVTVDQFESLKIQNETLEKSNKDLTEKITKLEKIFNERQTKTLDKEGILKALGLEKAPEKPIADLLSEKIGELNSKVEQLTGEISKRDAEIALNAKKAKVANLAKSFNFVDVEDVIKAIDFDNDDYETQIKNIAEKKPHWINKPKVGASYVNGTSTDGKSIEEQIKECYSRGDISTAMSLKRKLAFKK